VQVCRSLVGVIRAYPWAVPQDGFLFITRAFAKVCRKNYTAQATRMSQVASDDGSSNVYSNLLHKLPIRLTKSVTLWTHSRDQKRSSAETKQQKSHD
jgi:hypothetical protein